LAEQKIDEDIVLMDSGVSGLIVRWWHMSPMRLLEPIHPQYPSIFQQTRRW